VRALFATAGFFVIAGIAAASAQQHPKTIVHSSTPVEAVTQDGGRLAWLSGSRSKCNAIHLTGGGKVHVLPQPQSGSMTCRWRLTPGAQELAIAAHASAALWTLHELRADYVMTAQVGGQEVKVQRLAHQSDGTRWWLGGIAGSGTTLAYAAVDVEYVDPIGCGSGGSCAKKIAGGRIELVNAGKKTRLPHSGPALDLAVSDGRIAYIQPTAVSKTGAPVARSSSAVQVADVSTGAVVSQVNPVGVPLAIGLSAHLLAVLSRAAGDLKLTWYNPASGRRRGGITVSPKTAPTLVVGDHVIVYRVGHYLRALTVATHHTRALVKVTTGFVGLSLDKGRLVWAETTHTSGRIRSLSVG
jgi:hypothetical protein